MKLTKDILIEMIEQEINECGMMSVPPPPMPMVQGPHEDVPPEGDDQVESAKMIADLVGDIVYSLLADASPEGEVEEHDCEAEHPGESHDRWRVKGMLGKKDGGCGCG